MNLTASVLVALLGVTLIASAAYVLLMALRARHPEELWGVLAVHAALRLGAGAAALWFALLGWGAVAGWTMVAFLVIHVIWREIARRRARLA